MDSAPMPPPPPPMPGSTGAILLPTYKEQKQNGQAKSEQQQLQEQQYANLPPQLMNTLNKDKKPFTYTPLSMIGEKGKLDLSQIKSPRMRKRLMENQREDDKDQPNQLDQQQQEQYEPGPQPQKYFPVSPPRKLNILQEIQEQQQYQQPQMQQEESFPSPPTPICGNQFLNSPPITAQCQQQPYSYNSPLVSTPKPFYGSPVTNSTPKPYSAEIQQQPFKFPSPQTPQQTFSPSLYEQQPQQYFDIMPPKKIDIFREVKERQENQEHQPHSVVANVPTLQEQWLQRKQQQQSQPLYYTRQAQTSPIKQQQQQQKFANDEDAYPHEPVQSRSFKVLQRIVDNGNDDNARRTNNNFERQQEPEQRRTIPSNSFRYLQSSLGMNEEDALRQEQYHQPKERVIPIAIERDDSRQQQQLYGVPPSQQEHLVTPPCYQGATIPSRSFRLLQMMTDDDQMQRQQAYQPYQARTVSGFEGTDF